MKLTGSRRTARIGTALVATAVTGAAAFVVMGSGEDATGGADRAEGAAADGPVTTALRTVDFPAADGREVAIPRRDTAVFALVGVTWADPKINFKGSVSVRTRAVGGGWSDWQALDLDNHLGPEPGTEKKARGSTDPLWVGFSDGVEVRARTADGRSSDRLPAGLRLELVDPGRPKRQAGATGAGQVRLRPVAAMRTLEPTPSDPVPSDGTTTGPAPTGPAATTTAPTETSAPTGTPAPTATPTTPAPAGTSAPTPESTSAGTTATPGTTAGPVPAPAVVTRAGWKADESIVLEPPAYGTTVKAFFVHHTAGTSGYNCADSAAIVRGIEIYHVKSNGWNDIGYNFLVDKCGVVFEGRKGGIDRPVTGAHTYGFNTDSSAIAVLGTYTAAGVPPVVEDAVAHVAAYKLGRYGNDPYGSVTMVSGVDGKYDLGQSVVMNRISGHRDGVATECPGDALYAQLGPIRLKAGTIAKLALTGLTAGRSGTTYYTRGSFTASWSVGTSSALIDRFEVLVDGRVVATTAGTARSAGVTVTPGAHTVQIRAVHRLGRTATTAAQAVVGDTTVPAFRKAPAISLRTGTVNTTGVPVSLAWQATDNAALRASYLTAPSSVTFAPATTSWAGTARPGAAQTWSMRALDWAGNASTSSASRTTVLTAETSATRSAGWSGSASRYNLGGSALTSATRNASLKWTFTGRSVAVIAKRTSTSGQMHIYVDGVKAATVDLKAKSTMYRQAVWTRTWSAAGKHTVTAVVVGTSGRPRVTADGIAVIR